jgi:hypothetical protein
MCGLDSSGSREGPVSCPFERGHECSVSIEGGEFLHHLSNYQLLIDDSALCR